MATTERHNLSGPDDWWAAFAAEAKDCGMSLSEWLMNCGMDNLPLLEAAKLSKRPGHGRPKSEG